MYHVSKHIQLMELIAGTGAELVVTDTVIAPGSQSSLLVRCDEATDDPRNAVDYNLVMVPTRQAVIDLAAAFGFGTAVLMPRFVSWEGSPDFHEGRRHAFSSQRGRMPQGLEREAVRPRDRGLVGATKRFADRLYVRVRGPRP